jgi:cold shock CspA family protein
MKRKLFLLLVVFVAILSAYGFSYAESTVRVSVDSSGDQANSWSMYASTITDGRYVAFESYATNLVTGDTNGTNDIFVHDMQTGITNIVSVDSYGNVGNSWSAHIPSISSNGWYVVFESAATNLVPGDSNGTLDVFIHETQTGITNIVSVDSSGYQGNSGSEQPFISSDGSYVAFRSGATNLVPNDTNGTNDIFVHDMQTGITNIVSVDSSGNQANSWSAIPSISSDGRYVAFLSLASNLVTNDTNGTNDIFVHDRQTGATERVSVDSSGNQANDSSYFPTISSDGRYVAFFSKASNLVTNDTNGSRDVFVHDRQTGITEIVSVDSAGNHGNSHSYTHLASISSDGRYVAFESYASNLVSGDTNGSGDAFVHDRQTGITEIVSIDSAGYQGNSDSYEAAISSDGRYVAFGSYASDLVLGDTNAEDDIFVHDRDRDDDGDTYNNYTGGDCDDYNDTIYPGATEVNSDGIDQDCNGYDLTIDITKADYKGKTDTLTVWATSDLDAAADLVLENYSAMTWTGSRWEIVVEPAGGDPVTVTVTGIEGSESEQTK